MSRAKKILESLEDRREEVINDLVKVFGEEAKEEIFDSLKFDSGRYQDFGDAGEFTADGTEYNIIESEDEAERIALEIVEQDLEESPEMFNQNFLKNYLEIYPTDKRIIAGEEASNDAEERLSLLDKEEYKEVFDYIDKEDEWSEWEDRLLDAEDEEPIKKELEEYLRKEIEEWEAEAAEVIEKRLDDPIQYFVDTGIFSLEDLMKQNFIHINIEEAAKEAVSIDGWAHFLSHYYGNYETTENGFVYFRES